MKNNTSLHAFQGESHLPAGLFGKPESPCDISRLPSSAATNMTCREVKAFVQLGSSHSAPESCQTAQNIQLAPADAGEFVIVRLAGCTIMGLDYLCALSELHCCRAYLTSEAYQNMGTLMRHQRRQDVHNYARRHPLRGEISTMMSRSRTGASQAMRTEEKVKIQASPAQYDGTKYMPRSP